MKFEYNSDKNIEERIKLISNEIINEYPEIDIGSAKKIAVLDNPIDDKLTDDDRFYRYYMIMLVITKNHSSYMSVFNDALNVYKRGLKNDVLISAMNEIIKFNNGERQTFPILSEFYN